MGRRVTAQIPSSPDKIGTQFDEYKVNMNGRFYTIQCKVSNYKKSKKTRNQKLLNVQLGL